MVEAPSSTRSLRGGPESDPHRHTSVVTRRHGGCVERIERRASRKRRSRNLFVGGNIGAEQNSSCLEVFSCSLRSTDAPSNIVQSPSSTKLPRVSLEMSPLEIREQVVSELRKDSIQMCSSSFFSNYLPVIFPVFYSPAGTPPVLLRVASHSVQFSAGVRLSP